MDRELDVAYRAGIARGCHPRDLVLLAVHLRAPNASRFGARNHQGLSEARWHCSALPRDAALALLDAGDRASAAEACRKVRLEEVVVVQVREDGCIAFTSERRPTA
jgi:hypothetical protein